MPAPPHCASVQHNKASKQRSGCAWQVKQEIEILTRLHHPNIVDLKEVTASKDKIYLVMELVPGGELFDHIIANGPLQVTS